MVTELKLLSYLNLFCLSAKAVLIIERTFQNIYEAIKVNFYIMSKLTQCKITYLQYIFRKSIVVRLRVLILQLFLPFCTRN